MCAKWEEGKSKRYKELTISNANQLSEDTLKQLIESESRGKRKFFIMAVFFMILAVLFFCIDESGRKFTFEIAKVASFRGPMSAGALFGAILCVRWARIKIVFK